MKNGNKRFINLSEIKKATTNLNNCLDEYSDIVDKIIIVLNGIVSENTYSGPSSESLNQNIAVVKNLYNENKNFLSNYVNKLNKNIENISNLFASLKNESTSVIKNQSLDSQYDNYRVASDKNYNDKQQIQNATNVVEQTNGASISNATKVVEQTDGASMSNATNVVEQTNGVNTQSGGFYNFKKGEFADLGLNSSSGNPKRFDQPVGYNYVLNDKLKNSVASDNLPKPAPNVNNSRFSGGNSYNNTYYSLN